MGRYEHKTPGIARLSEDSTVLISVTRKKVGRPNSNKLKRRLPVQAAGLNCEMAELTALNRLNTLLGLRT